MDVDVTTPGASEGTADLGYDATHERVYPREYLEGIACFNAGRYYEAHEIWEEIWLRSTGETKMFYQTLIQAAVGLYHFERGNRRGAQSLYARVAEMLDKLPREWMSLDVSEFARQFKAFGAGWSDRNAETITSSDHPRPLIRLLPC